MKRLFWAIAIILGWCAWVRAVNIGQAPVYQTDSSGATVTPNPIANINKAGISTNVNGGNFGDVEDANTNTQNAVYSKNQLLLVAPHAAQTLGAAIATANPTVTVTPTWTATVAWPISINKAGVATNLNGGNFGDVEDANTNTQNAVYSKNQLLLVAPHAAQTLGAFIATLAPTPVATPTSLANITNGQSGFGLEKVNYSTRATSGSNASQTITITEASSHDMLQIYMTLSAGTATLEVDTSPDNTNWITVDTFAGVALSSGTTKVYTSNPNPGPGVIFLGTNTAVSPLAYRYTRVIAGAAGVGNTSTLWIGVK